MNDGLEQWERDLTDDNYLRWGLIYYVKNNGIKAAIEEYGVSRSTLYHWLKHEKVIRNNTYGNRKINRAASLEIKYEEMLERVRILETELFGIKSLFRDKLGV